MIAFIHRVKGTEAVVIRGWAVAELCFPVSISYRCDLRKK